jgi:hypothetical protein
VANQTLSITYCECVSVALVIQHATRMFPIVVCGLPSSTVLIRIILKKHDFLKGVDGHEMGVSIFFTIQ